MLRQRLCYAAALITLVLLLAGCGENEAAPSSVGRRDLLARIDRSLALSARFLVRQQSADGAWRSRVYGPLKDGPSLTPTILASLHAAAKNSEDERVAFRRGLAYLAALLDENGRVDAALRFPAYNAALASEVVALDGNNPGTIRERHAWIDYLHARQLNAALGWTEEDRQFGGWGYSVSLPRKPAPGDPPNLLAKSNISATAYALAALRSAKIPLSDPAYRQALVFVERCQNYANAPDMADSAFDDGGFFFMPDDPAWNKAGIAGADRFGRTRFHSYGSATADGLRALLDSGLRPDRPRVLAARRWLEDRFDAASNPGRFEPDRQVLRDATYYYYVCSLARAFAMLGVREIRTPAGPGDWTEALVKELLVRQSPDGSWANSYTDAKEDDPLVATPCAVAALAICREMISAGMDRVLSPARR